MKMIPSALMIAATIYASAMIAPAMAADGKGGAAVQAQVVGAGKPASGKRSSFRQRRAECEKQAEGKTGIERKKFMRECVHGPSAAKPSATPVAGAATKPHAARPAAPVKPAKPAEPTKPTEAAKPAAEPASHKDAYPPERIHNNPHLLARSCLQDARDQGLTPPDLQAFLKECTKSK